METDSDKNSKRTDEKKQKCQECGKRFKLKSSLIVHINKHKGKSYKCETCHKTYTASYSLVIHQRSHTGVRPYRCHTCGASFTSSGHRLRHEKTHAAGSTKPSRKPDSVKPREKKHDNFVHVCSVCHRIFSTARSLSTHKLQHLDRAFSCDICEKTFISQYLLNQHRLIHDGGKPFTCQVCNAAFRWKTNLTRHTKIHTGEKPAICDRCGKSFLDNSSLRLHQKCHMTTTNVTCPICRRTLKHSIYLKAHLKTHSKKKDFQCKQCGREFKHKRAYTIHIVKHADTENSVRKKGFFKPPEAFCNICGKGFVNRQSLNKHLKKHKEGGLKRFGSLYHSAKTNVTMSMENECETFESVPAQLVDSMYDNVDRVSSMLSENTEEQEKILTRKCEKEIAMFENITSKFRHDSTQFVNETTDFENILIEKETNEVEKILLLQDTSKDNNDKVEVEDETDNVNIGELVIDLDSERYTSVIERVVSISNADEHVLGQADRKVTQSSHQVNDGLQGTSESSRHAEMEEHVSIDKDRTWQENNPTPQFSKLCRQNDIQDFDVQKNSRVKERNHFSVMGGDQKYGTENSEVDKGSKIGQGNEQKQYQATEADGEHGNKNTSSQNELMCQFCMRVFNKALTLQLHVRTHHPDKLKRVHRKCPVDNCDFSTFSSLNYARHQFAHRKISNCATSERSLVISSQQSSDSNYEDSEVEAIKTSKSVVKESFFTTDNEIINHTDCSKKVIPVNCTWNEKIHSINNSNIKNNIEIGNSHNDSLLQSNNTTSYDAVRMPSKNRPDKRGIVITPCKSGKQDSKMRTSDSGEQDSKKGTCNSGEQDSKKRTVKLEFKCLDCSKSFRSKKILHSHIKEAHMSIKEYTCQLCGKLFQTKSGLNRHKVHHVGDTAEIQKVRNFMCTICGAQFTAAASLSKHTQRHTDPRPYSCDACGKQFSQTSHLNRHIKAQHEGVRRFFCKVNDCRKKFRDQNALQVHMRSHSGERPYRCDICQKSFVQSQAAKKHRQTHFDIRDFICHLCQQTFSRKNSLLRHLQRHKAAGKMVSVVDVGEMNAHYDSRHDGVKKMADKIEACDSCGGKFTTRKGLFSHKRKWCKGAVEGRVPTGYLSSGKPVVYGTMTQIKGLANSN